jgi:hypothetical protein
MTAGRSRVRLVAAVALAAAVAITATVLLTGSSSGDAGRLAWKGKVQVFDSGIPTDEILYSKVENTSLRDVDLDVEDVKVYGADGRAVRASVRFLAAFAHGLFPWSQKPDPLGDFERRRLGEIATLKPGQAIPITLAWRVPAGGEPPARVDFGPDDLDIPTARVREPGAG